MTTGVYQITCIPTGKRYIGSSCDIKERCLGHRSDLNRNNHHNSHLQNAWNKYGGKVFRFEVLEKCENGQEKIREQHHLDDKKPEFNIANDACGFSKGHQFTAESRAKMSASHKGETPWNKGKTTSKETCAKMSASHKGQTSWNKGKKPTAETCAKMSAAKKGKEPWNKGLKGVQKHTMETCAKISAALKGKPGPNEGKSSPFKDRKHTSEARAKISIAGKGRVPWNKGKKHTFEQRVKLLEAAKRRWARQKKEEEN